MLKCNYVSDSGKLLFAAEEQKDESLLIQIRGRDLVASEAMYHLSCYRRYTQYLSMSRSVDEGNPDLNPYQAGYTEFCKTVVEEKLMKGREVLRLSRLNALFKKIVRDKEGEDISSYKAYSLKARLKKSHPFLKFLRSATNDLVFVEDLTADEVIRDEDRQPSGTDSSEDDDPTDECHIGPQHRDDPAIKGLFIICISCYLKQANTYTT